MTRVLADLPEEDLRWLDARAAELGKSRAAVLRDLQSLLNARRRYFTAAWAPVLSNIVIIASLLLVPGIVDGREPELSEVLTNDQLRLTLGIGATLGPGLATGLRIAAIATGFTLPRWGQGGRQ